MKTYLVPLFTTRHGTSERLLVSSVHAHRTEDGLGADGALRGPRLVAVGLLEVHILLVALATCERVERSLRRAVGQTGLSFMGPLRPIIMAFGPIGVNHSNSACSLGQRSHNLYFMCHSGGFGEGLKYANSGKECIRFMEVSELRLFC